MQTYEASGRTVEEAIEKGAAALGVESDAVEVDVIQEPSQGGLLGIGKKEAIVKVWVKSSNQVEPHQDTVSYVVTATDFEDEVVADYLGDDMDEGITQEQTAEEKTAQEYLTKVLSFFEDGLNIKTHWEEDRLHIDVDGKDCGSIIGHKGETLNALQYLTTSCVNRSSEDRVRVVLDVCGYRNRRKSALEKTARRYAAEVVRRQAEFVMEPMSAADRRIVHYALQSFNGVTTASEGVEPNRSVVIIPTR